MMKTKVFLLTLLLASGCFAGAQRIQNLKVADTLRDSTLGARGIGYVRVKSTDGYFDVDTGHVDSCRRAEVADLSDSCTGGAVRAAKLTTARTIGGVSFDGTANIIPDTCKRSSTCAVADSSIIAKNSHFLIPAYTTTISNDTTKTIVKNSTTYTYTYSLGIITSFTDGVSTWNITYDSHYNVTAVTKL